MFINPKIPFPVPLVAAKLLKRKLGFSTLMDIIPLDANLIKGSHGRVDNPLEDQPVFISQHAQPSGMKATQVFGAILQQLDLA